MVLCSSRSEAMGHPTKESHSSIQITATYKIFTTQLVEDKNPIMSKEIINFKLENIWTSFATRMKTHKIYGIQIP